MISTKHYSAIEITCQILPSSLSRLLQMLPTMSLKDVNDRQSDTKPPFPESVAGGPEPPSGFILKLYQMVNGAPDEVISVRSRKCVTISRHLR